MNTSDVVTLISNLGFPIVACVALFWLNMKTSETYSKTIDDMRKTIDENTKVITQFLDTLKKG